MKTDSQVVPLRASETIKQEAADWMAKIDGGGLSERDRRALREWLAADPEHMKALTKFAAIWGEMDVLLNDFSRLREEKAGLWIFLRHNPWLSVPLAGICAGLLFCLGLVFFILEPPIEQELYLTRVGDMQLRQLSDGSTAHLNTDSTIEIEYSLSRRIVRLLRGEAMFDVAHDSERPFIVYAGGNAVKAIGTQFVIRLESENIVVTVTEGQVQLIKRRVARMKPLPVDAPPAAQEIVLVSKGEAVEVRDDLEQTIPVRVEREELTRRLSWIQGQLVFDGERLEQVVAEIGRYIPVKIVIVEPELRDIRISGRFKIGDTDALLEAIEVSMHIHVSRVGDQLIYLSRQSAG